MNTFCDNFRDVSVGMEGVRHNSHDTSNVKPKVDLFFFIENDPRIEGMYNFFFQTIHCMGILSH